MNDRTFVIDEIVKYSRKLHDMGFVANHDGNISARYNNTLLATPTAVSKWAMTPDMVITLDNDGKLIEGTGKPFSEIKLHLAAFRARPEVKVVMHAHPPFATARGLVNLPIRPALPEAIVSLGDIVPVVPFAMPGDKENDSIITNAFMETDTIMLPGNGVLTVGNCIEHAFLRLELVEHLAKIDYYATHMGVPMMLSDNNIAKLLEKRAAAGLGPRNNKSKVHPSETNNIQSQDQLSELKQLILEEIKKVLL